MHLSTENKNKETGDWSISYLTLYFLLTLQKGYNNETSQKRENFVSICVWFFDGKSQIVFLPKLMVGIGRKGQVFFFFNSLDDLFQFVYYGSLESSILVFCCLCDEVLVGWLNN